MGKSKRNWYERNEIQRVTLDYVKANCNITQREKELLKIINYRKLVRRDMLEVISPDYRYLGDSRTRLINRSINKMFKNMCLDKVHEPQKFMQGNSPAIVSLDKAGSIILGIPHKKRIKKEKKVIKGVPYIFRYLPANYRHVNGVNNLEVESILFCEKHNVNLIEWELESITSITYNQELNILIPDVIMSLEFPTKDNKVFNAFIEFDTGSEGLRYKAPPIIKEKIIKYNKYRLSGLWENKYSYFPVVLLVTEDENRIDFFNNECEKMNLKGIGIYYKNYSKLLEEIFNII